MTISIYIKKGAAIAEGWFRYALNIRTDIMVYREENYCKRCPLALEDGKYTGMCNKAEGGCGCGTGAKTSQNLLGCPKGFFDIDSFRPELFDEFINQTK